MILTWKKTIAVVVTSISVALAASGGGNAANLVTNGDFETNTGSGQLGFNTGAAGWSVPAPPGSYTFLFNGGAGAQAGTGGQYGFLAIWGLGNGGAGPGVVDSPTGGYFIAQDSAFQQGAIVQSIAGLVPGASYNVQFDWAAVQQLYFNGPNSSQWIVSLGGGASMSTALDTIPSHGGTNWMHESFNLTAGNANNLLSFYANGSPQVPPFALLDGVSLTQNTGVPEPSSVILWGLGIVGFGVARWRRRAKAAVV